MNELITYRGLVSLVYEENSVGYQPTTMTSSIEAAEFFRAIYPKGSIQHVERMYAAYLNNSNEVNGVALISLGGICSTICDPKVIFQYALQLNAVGIVLCHNHPSGSLKPSKSDIQLTKKVKLAAKHLDLRLLDHIILTEISHSQVMDLSH
jgi:DNA repair protein RadC